MPVNLRMTFWCLQLFQKTNTKTWTTFQILRQKFIQFWWCFFGKLKAPKVILRLTDFYSQLPIICAHPFIPTAVWEISLNFQMHICTYPTIPKFPNLVQVLGGKSSFVGFFSKTTTADPPLTRKSLTRFPLHVFWLMYVEVGGLALVGDHSTVPLTRDSCNTVFSKSQKTRKAGTLCTYPVKTIKKS